MTEFISETPALQVSRKGGQVIVENDFVQWIHDSAHGGELCAASVKNGSGKNLLVRPQSTAVCPWVRGGWRQYHYYETIYAHTDGEIKISRKNDTVRLDFSSGLADEKGEILQDVKVLHSVLYRASGAAEHCVELQFAQDLDIGHVRIGTLDIRNDMNQLAVRPCAESSWAVELQNPCQWIELKHGKSRSDLPAYRSRFLPLSVMLIQTGVEGIEMSMGDDLGAWDGLGTEVPGLQQGSVCEAVKINAYEVVFSPLDSPRAGNIIPKGSHKFTYRLALPYVRKNIVPLEIASTFLRPGFETRWPDYAWLKELKHKHVGMLRLHNDGDLYGNGIFWRDTDYPPYPAEEMKKMDQALQAAEKADIAVVPYFSVKEYHPDTAGFKKDAERFARQVIPHEKLMENFFGTSLFGMQMCLESDWYKTRRSTIEKALNHHAFKGLYYDWCMGLECINPAHNGGKRHWDNDKLLDLLEWSRKKAGDAGKLYLHLTNVPNFA